ncbi:hypothetical protein [Shewanella sp. YIC-542]|uniref:hypothetical protein n=1 Tax=Shewanella mytili TaxID=3377111 RepID=UPI00398E5AC0
MFMDEAHCKKLFRTHWFFLAAVIIVISDISVAVVDNWSSPAFLEAAILVDLGIVIPVLYWWRYRARNKAAMLRTMALSCLGIWVAGHVVPSEHHRILPVVDFVRYIGLGILLVIEFKFIIMIYRAAFHGEEATSSVLVTAKDAGMPDWVVRLIAWEASFWRKVWRMVQRMIVRH